MNIRTLVSGAVAMEKACGEDIPFEKNPAAIYAATRNALYQSGKKIEILVNFNPKLHFFAEWWKQLYGESEGKENLGIYPDISLTSRPIYIRWDNGFRKVKEPSSNPFLRLPK